MEEAEAKSPAEQVQEIEKLVSEGGGEPGEDRQVGVQPDPLNPSHRQRQ
ncbi:MAG: hypothetical protein H0T69_02965 [Thermoleophilaceae bacterium]|nr:hypothetical protein [Thermoleophilaceae bacterium]